MTITKKNLAVLVFIGLHFHIKEMLEHFEVLTTKKLLQKALVVESGSNFGECHKSHHPNMHAIEYHLDISDDELISYSSEPTVNVEI